jgi:hypothetical protein
MAREGWSKGKLQAGSMGSSWEGMVMPWQSWDRKAFVVWVGGVRAQDGDGMPKLHGKRKMWDGIGSARGPLVMHGSAIGKGHLHGIGPGLLLERATVGWV